MCSSAEAQRLPILPHLDGLARGNVRDSDCGVRAAADDPRGVELETVHGPIVGLAPPQNGSLQVST
eukprot:scaffold2191_cov254-Pinguiococcus_pyrenoidosus.AAC.5